MSYTSIIGMRLPALALLLVFSLRAEPALLAYDATGKLLSQSDAVFRSGGYAYVVREALYGAKAASIRDREGRLHPVLWVTGEDTDAGVAEVFVGVQAPRGPDNTSGLTPRARAQDHDAMVRQPREAGAFGQIARLDCDLKDLDHSGPLFDDHGLFAGWHASRIVDGSTISFAIPIERVDAISRTLRLDLAAWNDKHDLAREEPYNLGVGHVWADDYDGALFYFRKAAQLDPTNARAWLHLGFAEGKNGRSRARIDCYRKAIALDPELAEARYFLGVWLLMSGKTDEAEEQLKQLKKLESNYALRLQLFLDAVHVDKIKPQKQRKTNEARRLA